MPSRSLARLRRAGVVVRAEPNRRLVLAGRAGATDEPLASTEWWRSVVSADGSPAPGPGKPVTIVDSGLDVTHEEFRSRPDTILMNEQTVTGPEEDHGTEVASVIGAPINGVGLVGVYPRALLRSWDASPYGIITEGLAIEGISEAARQGPGVINLSLGTPLPEPLLEQAVLFAYRSGSLVVASAGNDGLHGSPLSYPASFPHVLAAAASDQSGFAAPWSSRSAYVSVTAPGSHIPVAKPTSDIPSGYDVASGTSFSAPIVSGAAAWVWTARPDLDNTQLFDVMRMSAFDIAPLGADPASGFGMLNIPAALVFPAPPPDPLEPNDNIDEVSPTGLFRGGEPAITKPGKGSTTLLARVDRYEDPVDVYRVFVPAHGSVTARTSGGTVDLRLYGAAATSISAKPVAVSARPGLKSDTATIRNTRARGVYAYVAVKPDRATIRTSYVLRITTAVRR